MRPMQTDVTQMKATNGTNGHHIATALNGNGETNKPPFRDPETDKMLNTAGYYQGAFETAVVLERKLKIYSILAAAIICILGLTAWHQFRCKESLLAELKESKTTAANWRSEAQAETHQLEELRFQFSRYTKYANEHNVYFTGLQ
jgi:hypothetical protein